MPVRLPDPASLLKIYWSFDCGNLLSQHMLEVNKLTVADGTQAGAKFAGTAVTSPGFDWCFRPPWWPRQAWPWQFNYWSMKSAK